MRRILKFTLFLLLFVAVALLCASYYVYSELNRPYKGYSEPKKAVSIAPGTSLNQIVHTMQSQGIVRHEWLLEGLFLYYGTTGKSKAGDYVFDRPMTTFQVYKKLLKGEFVYRVLKIIDGNDSFDVSRAVALAGVGQESEFAEALKSPATLDGLHAIDPSLNSTEGFLFPETYFVARWDSVQKAVLMMLDEFQKRYGQDKHKRAAELGMTTLQVVTLASLVEKEAANDQERPLIAGVFQNRLQKGMLLQCDPTVIYAMKLTNQYNGQILSRDLKMESPYNTYMVAGLPPGPICNPGLKSILAVLYPEKTDKLYFVLKDDHTHYFSSTLEEHNRAVAQYRRHRQTTETQSH